MLCAIVQPSYIPWRGYFDMIRRVDLFVFYDDVQYDRRGWRNRNRVKSPDGTRWLTIPVQARGAQTKGLRIDSIRTDGTSWSGDHFSTLQRLYGKAPHFSDYSEWLGRVYSAPPPLLADFTIALVRDIAGLLGIRNTQFLRSSALGAKGTKSERLLDVLRRVGGTRYLSGPSAREYIDESRFAEENIVLEWMDYSYPEYPQLYPPYDPHVSVLDLLFMTGDRASDYIFGHRWRINELPCHP